MRDAVMDDMAGCRRCLDAVAQEGRWLSRLHAAPLELYTAFWASLREARAPQTVAWTARRLSAGATSSRMHHPSERTWEASA